MAAPPVPCWRGKGRPPGAGTHGPNATAGRGGGARAGSGWRRGQGWRAGNGHGWLDLGGAHGSAPLPRGSDLAAVVGGPGRGAALGVGLLERLVLLGDRGVLRQPGVAERRPGGRQELVQATSPRRGVDRVGVPAALPGYHASLEGPRSASLDVLGRGGLRLGCRGGSGLLLGWSLLI